MRNGRYLVTKLPGEHEKPYVIFDRMWRGYCTLPAGGDGATLLPLEWRSRSGAEEWLGRCRLAWLYDKAPVPEGAGASKVVQYVKDGWGTKRSGYWI